MFFNGLESILWIPAFTGMTKKESNNKLRGQIHIKEW